MTYREKFYEFLYARSIFPIVATLGNAREENLAPAWHRAAWKGASWRTFLATLAIIAWEAASAADWALSFRFWRQRWAVERALRRVKRKLTPPAPPTPGEITLEDFGEPVPWYVPLN